MSKSKLVRASLFGSAAAFALLGATTAAQAVETEFGEVSIVFDTTFSVGASMRTSDRENGFLSEGNGGNRDPRDGPGGIIAINVPLIPSYAPGLFGAARYTANRDNFDGSTQTDDGRLNFNNGDLIGANVKASHDLQMSWRNYKVFVRALGFYDVIMNDHSVGERSELTDAALGDVGRNYELLDAFISADYTIADMPVNLRAGKQVINWGESTFILGGNNVFNPIDVGAFRRPGSEIKEALIPVNAIYGSISLPFDVSLSGYYALDYEPFEIDPSGTPFSGADVVAQGSGIGGNEDRVSFLASSPVTGMRRNCTAASPTVPASATGFVQTADIDPITAGVQTFLNNAQVAQPGVLDCTDDNAFTGIFANTIDYTSLYTVGRAELTRLGLVRLLTAGGLANVSREQFGVVDHGGEGEQLVDDQGQFGISARWYAASLGGTEFGFYYQNYHSRLPFVSERVGGRGEISIGVTGTSAQATAGGIGGRQLLPAGCGINAAAPPANAHIMGLTATGATTAVNGAFGDATNGTPNGIGLDDTLVDDPQDLINATLAAAIANHTTGPFGPPLTLTQSASGSWDTVMNLMKVNCMLAWYQSQSINFGTGPVTQLLNGAETLGLNSDIDLLIEYPEDIEAWGMSFNTTLWGWGVQGDFTYRQNAPFQIDADSLTIAAAWKNCAFQANTVASSLAALAALRTPDGSGLQPNCLAAGGVGAAAGQSPYVKGWKDNQMYTGQIGTTATFTASDWWVDGLGADLGIIVTEVGFVLVPGVENEYLDLGTFNRVFPVYATTGCQGGDLPLGGLLGIDTKKSIQCRPDDFSAGGVLLARLDYNNAFDTGWVVSPQIVYSYDFMGSTPAPYGNYMEDRQAVGLNVTGTLNNNMRVGASYTNFFGGHINNKAKDLDFASITASYTY